MAEHVKRLETHLRNQQWGDAKKAVKDVFEKTGMARNELGKLLAVSDSKTAKELALKLQEKRAGQSYLQWGLSLIPGYHETPQSRTKSVESLIDAIKQGGPLEETDEEKALKDQAIQKDDEPIFNNKVNHQDLKPPETRSKTPESPPKTQPTSPLIKKPENTFDEIFSQFVEQEKDKL